MGFITESKGNENTASLIQLQSAQLKYCYEVQQPLLIQISQQQQMILEELKKTQQRLDNYAVGGCTIVFYAQRIKLSLDVRRVGDSSSSTYLTSPALCATSPKIMGGKYGSSANALSYQTRGSSRLPNPRFGMDAEPYPGMTSPSTLRVATSPAAGEASMGYAIPSPPKLKPSFSRCGPLPFNKGRKKASL